MLTWNQELIFIYSLGYEQLLYHWTHETELTAFVKANAAAWRKRMDDLEKQEGGVLWKK